MDHQSEVLLVPVERVVTRRTDVVGQQDSVALAAALMATCGCRHLAVVDSDGRLVGTLSELDLRARLGIELESFPDAARKLLQEPVGSIMSRGALSMSRRAPLRDALAILLRGRVGALPVTNDDDRPIGIVSYVDLLAYFADALPGSRAGPRRRKGARQGQNLGRARAASRPRRARERAEHATGDRRVVRGRLAGCAVAGIQLGPFVDGDPAKGDP